MRDGTDLSPVVSGTVIVGSGACGIVPPMALMEALLAVLFDLRELLFGPGASVAHAVGGGAGLFFGTFAPFAIIPGGFPQLG